MTTLKIGLVLDDSLDKPDGVQQYVLAIGEWFRSQGHDVHYLVGQTERSDIEHVHSLSRNLAVRFNHNNMSMPLPSSRKALRELLKAEQFDVLHVQMPYSPWLAHRIITATGRKTVVFGTFHIVAHSRLVGLATRVLAGWTRKSLKRFDEIVSVSSAAATYAKATYGIETEVLPNVVDYERFHAAQPLPQYDDNVVTVLFLGRLVARKGCLVLLKAITRLRTKYPDAPHYRVLICGKGPLEAQLKQYVSEHNLEDVVTFVGFVSEELKPRYYASADIAVFPSTGGESFGIVLIEAMAAGRTAVLAGNNSGYRTVLEPQPEQLFNPNNISELTQKLWEYLSDVKKRQAAAKWGVNYTKQFDTAKVGAILLTRYQQALRKRSRP